MSLTISKRLPYQILFALCVGVPYLNNYELTFGIWAFTVGITIASSYTLSFLKQLSCFIAIFGIAFLVMLNKSYSLYYIIRDATYLIKPIFGLLIGYQLIKKIGVREALRTVVGVGIFIAFVHLAVIFVAIVAFHATSVNELRLRAGYFSDYEVYALIILLFHKKFELTYSKKAFFFFTLILGFSIFSYLARTNFIQFALLFVGMKGYFKLNKKSIMIIGVIAGLTVVGYSTILYINPKRNGQGLEALLYKIKIAPTEPFKTKIDRADWRDINDNYRSYENIMTVKQVTGNDAVLFGEGMGSKIDLKQKMWLGDIEQRYISILHNGFMTVFLKSGLLGVLFLIISIILLFQNPRSPLPKVKQINLLFVGSGVFMIVSAWVFMGLYFLADTKSILFGALLCFRGLVIKEQRKIDISNG